MRTLSLFAVIAALQFSDAAARHVDIVPYYEIDAIGHRTFSVGSYDLTGPSDGSQSIQRNVVVFHGGAGVTPSSAPGSVVNGNPGWNRPFDFHGIFEGEEMFGANYPDGTGPSGFGVLGFNVVVDARLGRNLSYWDGTGTPSFGPVPGGEILDLYKSNGFGAPLPSHHITLAGEAAGMPGFTVTPTGGGLHPGFHEHTAAALWGSATRQPDDMPTEGWYLYSRTITVANDVIETGGFPIVITGTQESRVFHTLLYYETYPAVIYEEGNFIYQFQLNEDGSDYVYDDEGNPLLLLDEVGNPVHELDELGNPRREIIERYPTLEAAVTWVNENLGAPVPEPASLTLLSLAMSAPLLRRRRRS